ncbi:MAG TPA: YggS family pyridoxal phosphate-dependent enzyme [Thermomicrobiales bacterium]|nr:YggS family pyridoxal phosphate-dependent enzyme [Thermomicrobiales bacterium]
MTCAVPLDLERRAATVRLQVEAAATRADRDPGEITIVAVSKTFPRSYVEAAYHLGFRAFGENRVQEIRTKYEEPLPADARIHLIGALQTNKVRQAVRVVNRVETVDRIALVETLAKELPRQGVTCSVLIQVNIAGETQKSGCRPEEAEKLLSQIANVPELSCDGLMTMAPYVDDSETVRPVFTELRTLRDHLQQVSGLALPDLSMGMSGDFRVAIEEGSTHVRLGRALFGDR